jgi:hypothetical protein
VLAHVATEESSVPNENGEGIEPQGFDRLSLVKKLAIGAFAAPVIASFGLDSIARAGTFEGGKHGHQACPNQSWANQSVANGTVEQPVDNQSWGNQSVANGSKPPCDDKHKGHRPPESDPPPVIV